MPGAGPELPGIRRAVGIDHGDLLLDPGNRPKYTTKYSMVLH
jgi:hypothetical protein